MAEALKDMYNEEFLSSLSDKLHVVYRSFDREKFIHTVIDETKLKSRMRRITETLGLYLPEGMKMHWKCCLLLMSFALDFHISFFLIL